MDAKERIKKFGEVFTGDQQVNDMLDLVKNETQRIDSRFLEPACGNGNFLIRVLDRKLSIIEKYKKNQIEYERYTFQAVSSIYGVEIIKENTDACNERLFNHFHQKYKNIFQEKINSNFIKVINFVIKKNILWGDALTFKNPENNNPIIFTEWSFIKGSLVQRSDYNLSDLLAYRPFNDQDTLFSDEGNEVIIPPPIKVYKPINLYDIVSE